MAYNEIIAQQIRECIVPYSDDLIEKKMFGGICFLYKNKMSVGVVKNELMVRIVSEKYKKVLLKENVRPMDFNGKIMKDFVFVNENGFQTNNELTEWILLGIEHAERASKQ